MRIVFLIVLVWSVTISASGQDILFMSGPLRNADPAIIPVLEEQLATADRLVLLGDFLNRQSIKAYAKRKPDPVLELIRNFKGPVDWVPGREEWGAIRGNAADNLNFLRKELQDIDTSWHVLPDGGCPGPVAVEASDSVTLLFVNSNWWLNEGEKPEAADCGLEDVAGIFVELEELLRQYDHTKVFLVSYHPFHSLGRRGGYFPVSTHLLPPLGGSLYAGYRKWIGGRHDLSNYFYKSMMGDFMEVIQEYPDITIVSALEPVFQYIPGEAVSQLTVGNIARGGYVRERENVVISAIAGFTVLDMSDGPVAHFYSAEGSEQAFLTPNRMPAPADRLLESAFPSTVDVAATGKLHKDQRRPVLLGKNYRDEWETIIANVPVFDLSTEKGGLKIVKQGGGMQTRSLRLEAADEKQYVLRSIEKFPEKAVPAELRNTIAEDVVADQISASHPYGAFVIPPLAGAAGVYHTNPRLVWLPDDPRLGKYREDFANGLYLFEERPDDDWRDLDSFGNSKKIMSTADVIQKLENDGDHIIDQEQTVRSRLFDIWIGDWDRHDDQWRWARFKPENENDIKYYQPIPRDRDQAFFWSDGSMLRLSSRRWGQPKFQGFNEEIRDVAGLEFNARHFDRTFLTGAEKELWIQTARELKESLTNEVIENAIKGFPPEIYALHGEEIIHKLKARREDLVRYAEEYYLFLSEIVTITASDKEDLIEVVRLPDGSVGVEVWRISGKSGNKKYKYYEREFDPSETREIRIFAFGDDDIINISGESNGGPLIRIIGGKGDDMLNDQSNVHGPGRKTIAYDTPGMKIQSSGEVRDRRSEKEGINKYDRYSFKFNTTMPLVTGGFNPDDGIFIGGGLVATRHGFRKEPYKLKHNFLASLAPRSGSYNFSYDLHFVDLIGNWDLQLEADVSEPSYADFFYGFGNKTNFNEDLWDEDRQFYRVHYHQWILKPMLRHSTTDEKHRFMIGPSFRSIEVEEDDNEDGARFISLYADYTGRGPETDIPFLETRRFYVGLEGRYQFDLRDQALFPKEGLLWNVEAAAFRQIGEEENDFRQVCSDLSVYSTVGGSLRTTLAFRLGGQVNFGEYEFYQAARLGGTRNLRGYRKFRFAGEKTFFTNLEIRTKLIQFNSFLFPAEVGILLFHDLGRVWEPSSDEIISDPKMNTWHRGMGTGIWISPLGQLVISADYGISNDDERAFFVRFGFMF